METNENFMRQLNAMLTDETGIQNMYGKLCGKLTLEDLFTTDMVYTAAYHCSLGFTRKKDTSAFLASPWLNSYELSQQVLNGEYRPKYYREQVITERGKPRVIRPPHFTCKVVQKVLCNNVLRPLLEPKMVNTVYSSIRGRGLSDCFTAILNALNHRGNEDSVIVLVDFSNFFGSIDHEVLRYQVGRYIEDERVTDLFMSFCDGDVGLSLGNEASQIPASYFPSPVDHELKDHLGCRCHYRYMDDICLLAENDAQADMYIDAIQRKRKNLRLILKDEKIRKMQYGQPFTFCKERFLFNKSDGIYYRIQNPAIPRTEKRKIRRFGEMIENGTMNKERAELQIRSVVNGMKKHPNNYKRVREVEELAEECGIETGPEA